MPDVVDDPVGAAWLMRHYGIALPGRLRVTSRIGGRRMTQTDGVVSRGVVPTHTAVYLAECG